MSSAATIARATETASTASWTRLAFGSLLLSLLFGAFFWLPFAHLWGTLPAPTADPLMGAPEQPSWITSLAIAVIFGMPSLVPFALLRRPIPWVTPLAGLALVGVVGLIVLPALVGLATYPCCTSDVLDYVNRQRLWTVYGGNPFEVVPNDHPEDWSYYFALFRDRVFGYGPLWWFIARAFTQFAQTLDQYLIGFKILAAACFAASLGLIWQLSPPARRVQNAVFFAWNPIILIDGVLRLHNDLLTVPLLLLALWLWQRRSATALPTVALGALIKLTVAPLAVLIAVDWLARRQRLRLVIGGVASVLAAVSLYSPFWVGLSTLQPMLVQANRAQWSIGAVLLRLLAPVLGDSANPVVRVVLALGGLGLLVVLLWRVAAESRARGLTTASLAGYGALALLVGLLSTPLAFYSHYLSPVIALAALAADNRVRGLVLALSFGALVNAVLGVDQFMGGPQGDLLDVIGNVVLLAAVMVGLVRFRRPAQVARVLG
ncbi:MAG TPA: hypothetical protein VGQ62_08990 [Chloroflexota bacterium]|nr:hypothetical protein [Chloroflexota bacterium]